ncbi:hypothetical protein X777_13136 [Ooceraea biroi]|uniref:Uncharacterized protein n=1 Tax=Ooceraea biroi TaxID=2015173 RepID=A0A026X0K9_OOCBI|nr:hypothetical protein X777_13136 [Ooceraea biroi]
MTYRYSRTPIATNNPPSSRYRGNAGAVWIHKVRSRKAEGISIEVELDAHRAAADPDEPHRAKSRTTREGQTGKRTRTRTRTAAGNEDCDITPL